MNIESSRDPERYTHRWMLPLRMTRQQAIKYFEAKVKPRSYELTTFRYDPWTGIAETW